MEKTLLMAVDLGTSFIKSAVYNTDSECIAVSMAAVKDDRPGPGIFIQKGEDLVDAAVECMKQVCAELGERAGDIAAISFTGQMSGFMGVDKNWNDVTTWSCSLDSRYMPYADKQMKELKKDFLEISGTNFPAMAPKYEWYKTEFPDESKKIAKYLMISGYMIGQLSDIDIDDAVMDGTYTSWTGLADISKGVWSDKICDAVGLDQKYLPKIVNSNTICGKLSDKMAKAIGLKSGIALVSGAGDKMAGCLGSAITGYGEMNFEASSYGGVHECVPEYRPDMQKGLYDCLPSPVPGKLYLAKFVTGSGITLDWYVNTFAREEGQKLGEAFGKLEEKMKKIPPGANGLMSIGLLSGSAMPIDGALRGMWMGFDWSHKKEHFYKAILESITFDFTLTMDRYKEMYPEYNTRTVKIVGGGAKSAYWTQMLADVQDNKYQVLDRDDVAMWAAAILAGNAIGVFPDMEKTAAQHAKVKKEFAPTPGVRQSYEPYLKLYEDYVKELRDFYLRIQEVNAAAEAAAK